MTQLYAIYSLNSKNFEHMIQNKEVYDLQLKKIETACSNGIKWFQFRFKFLSADASRPLIHPPLLRFILEIIEICQKWRIQFILNDHLLWMESLLGYSWDLQPGLHLGQGDSQLLEARQQLGQKAPDESKRGQVYPRH